MAKPVKKGVVKATKSKGALLTNEAQTVAITEIKDLSTSTVITISAADLKKLTPNTHFSEKVSAEITKPGNMPAKSGNIQVIWSETKNGKTTTKARGVGGSMNYEDGELTITGLKNVSKLSLGVSGILDIGPVPKDGEPKKTVAHMNVNIGNLNKDQDWIINLSEKDKGGTGSYIKLNELIDWVKGKADVDDTDMTLPKDGADEATAVQKQPSEFTILFNDFNINITKKTFRFDVQSKADESMTFGNFTISNIGFIVTNEPYIADLPADDATDDDGEDE